MVQTTQISHSFTYEEDPKVYRGEIGKRFPQIILYTVFQKLYKRLRKYFPGTDRQETTKARLISQRSFFWEDYIDVSLDFVPEVGQKIKVNEIQREFRILRKSDQLREFQLLKIEEGLEHSSKLIALEYLREKYPYLLYPSDKGYDSCVLLEVEEISHVEN